MDEEALWFHSFAFTAWRRRLGIHCITHEEIRVLGGTTLQRLHAFSL